MINIPIDERSSIVQPYYDGGESYIGHHKYSLVNQYQAFPQGSLKQTWCEFTVSAEPGDEVVLEYEGTEIDISAYNRFRIFGSVPKCINIKLYCNGELVLEEPGNGCVGYIDAHMRTKQMVIRKLKYIFQNTGENKESISLFYLGMLNDKEQQPGSYTSEWEGCFSEEPNYDLYNELTLSREAMAALREKVKKDPLRKTYERMKSEAYELMQLEPEKMIAKTIQKHHRAPMTRLMGAEVLAICGQVEQDEEMLRMACRYALSLACCENWCADVMETVQTVTWHHRSFAEADTVSAVCTVISLAGGILSWHGLNLLYNAIIMKAMPRMEADFMTMDYIYKCNQGIVFMKGYLFSLATLMQRYPRYQRRYEDAKLLLEEMYQCSFEPDGGFHEGAGYWNYTVTRYLGCLYIISRCENKTLRDVVGDRLNRTSDYGLACLDQNGYLIPFNDCEYPSDYRIMTPAVLYSITGNKAWAAVYHQCKSECTVYYEMLIAASVDVPEVEESVLKEFVTFQSVGLTVCTRENVQIAMQGGPSNNTHSHCDKGSFLLNVDGMGVIPDCTRAYTNPVNIVLHHSDCHSLAIPVTDGKLGEQYQGEGYSAPVVVAECVNGVFRWKCDLSSIWNVPGLVEASREVVSEKKNEYTFIDHFVFEKEGAVQFRVNYLEGAKLQIMPKNWSPEKKEDRVLIADDIQTVNQRILTSKEAKEVELVTVIKL